MSYKWPDKDKDEIVDYSIDWSRLLNTDVITATHFYIKQEDGTKVRLADADVVDGLQFVTATTSGQVTTARFSLGTNNVRYTIIGNIRTEEGLQYERSVFLRVREK